MNKVKSLLQYAGYKCAFGLERLVEAAPADVPSGNRVPRICVVKQDVYNDLYCCHIGSDFRHLVFSSLKRSGPVALFSDLKAEFVIVRTEDTPECNVWQQKWYDCGQKPLEHYYGLQKSANPFGENTLSGGQAQYAVPAESIDWSRYDIVLSLDVSVPSRVTKRYPDVLWCYWISEPCMGDYRKSHFRPISGYQAFLNQRFWLRGIFPNASHEIDFPYAFLRPGCMKSLAKVGPRRGVMIESHTKHLLSAAEVAELEQFGPVRFIGGSIQDIIQGLHESKYWVRQGGRYLWGNGMAEAIACGCLAIANPAEFKNRSLFTKGAICGSLRGAIDLISRFEADPKSYASELAEQERRLEYYCFARPVARLLARLDEVRARIV